MAWRARLSINIRKFQFQYNMEDPSSQGLQNFLKNNYNDLKQLNPNLPFLVRPVEEKTPPVIIADYGIHYIHYFYCYFNLNLLIGFQREDLVLVSNFSENQILKQMKKFNDFGEIVLKKEPDFKIEDSLGSDVINFNERFKRFV